jgi:hypothetical protein
MSNTERIVLSSDDTDQILVDVLGKMKYMRGVRNGCPWLFGRGCPKGV